MEYKEYMRIYNKHYNSNHLATFAKSYSESGEQRHVHEFLDSTKLAEQGDERHNHRFAGVTGEAIPFNGSHIHKILTNTDFFDHFHVIKVKTGPAQNVGKGKHVHLVTGTTTFVDGHVHDFIFTTQIESPLL